MITFSARYLDGKTSRSRDVRATLSGGRLSLIGDGIDISGIPLKGCKIPPAIGGTMRPLLLPSGARLETEDGNALSNVEAQLRLNRGMRVVNRLETHWRAVLVCLAGLVVSSWLFITEGIPFIAEKAAAAIPVTLSERISRETLRMLDAHYLAPSALGEEKQKALSVLFRDIATGRGGEFSYRLELRKGKLIGANAFALPSGLVVMTDELVKLAERDEELAGILIHEMIHIEERHGLRSVFQNAGVFLLVSALAGDITSITSVASTLPTLLAQTGYSRTFEREADDGAGRFMIEKGWGTKPLVDILDRLSRSHGELAGMSLLATHPETAERMKFLQTQQAAP